MKRIEGVCRKVFRCIRSVWREVSGYNSLRRERIINRLLVRRLVRYELELESALRSADGRERVRIHNELFKIRVLRTINRI